MVGREIVKVSLPYFHTKKRNVLVKSREKPFRGETSIVILEFCFTFTLPFYHGFGSI